VECQVLEAHDAVVLADEVPLMNKVRTEENKKLHLI